MVVQKKKGLLLITICCVAFATAVLVAPSPLEAQTACAKVQIEILQELTLERIAFDAKMVITNNA